MKRIVYTITLLSGLACCWGACSKDEEEMIEKRKAVTETEITDETESDGSTGEGTTKAYTYSNPVTIAMGEEYGTLKDKLGDNLETADKLILTGKIDANDVQTFLHEMPALLAIDMAEVTFVETDAKFASPNTTPTSLTESLKENQIGNYMFFGKGYQEIVLPKTTTEIGERAFCGCKALKNMTLPDRITELPYGVFWDCTLLESVHLPANLKKIGEIAFYQCPALTTIELPATLEEIGRKAFSDSGLSSIDLTQSSLTTLGTSAFSSTNLTSITIPASITSISEYCFYNCQKLTSVSLPEDLKSVGKHAFAYCSFLPSISLPEGLISIEEYTFQYCGNLTSVNFPSTLTTINNGAFEFCGALGAISLPQNLQTIEECAFRGCTKMTFDPHLPESLTSIGNFAFSELRAMKEFIFPSGVTTLPNYVCFNCANLQSITISEGCTSIGQGAFRKDDPTAKLATIHLPSTLTTIGNEAFSGCGVTDLNFLNEGLKTIGNHAFDRCDLNGDLTLPSTIEQMGYGVFAGNSNSITSIHLQNTSTSVELGDLFNTQVNCLVYSPSDRVSMTNTTAQQHLPNIICNGRISSLILIESKPFRCPEAFVAGRVTFTKQFNRYGWWGSGVESRMTKGKASNWYGLSLPFKVDQITATAKDGNTYTFAPFGSDTDGDTKPFWLRRLTTSGDFTFENKTVIEAGEPYIIAFPNSESYADEYNVAGDVTFSATGTITIPVTEEREVSSGGFNYMRSNYEILPKAASIYLLNSPHTDGDMGGVLGNYSYWGSYFIRSLRDSWPFEAYVTSSSGAAAIGINPATPTTRSNGPQGPVPGIDDM